MAVAAGGALGSVLRWALDLLLRGGDWPWGTLVINVAGSAALAALVVHLDRHARPRWLGPALGTGLLGGFTTFSAYAVQVLVLGATEPVVAVAYLVTTPVLCVGAAVLAGSVGLRAGGAR